MTQKSQLYLHDYLRDYLKSEIESFRKFYDERLFPNFDNLETEAENHSDVFYQRALETYNPDIDPSSIADSALEEGIGKYQELSLIKYEFTASAISTSFMLWEQQVRRFLYKEMQHCFKIKMKNFCTNVKEIKQLFAYHGVDIESLDCWGKVNELQLLNNVIKHGDGRSAEELRQFNKSLFDNRYIQDDFPLSIESTLLSEVLAVSQSLFNEYCKYLKTFWDQLPERSFGP